MPEDTKTTTKAPSNSAGVSELIQLGRSIGAPVVGPDCQPGLVLPAEFRFEELPPAKDAPLPDHIKQKVVLVDAESFSAYVNRYKSEETLIFASLPDAAGNGSGFVAVLDFHKQAQSEPPAGPPLTQANRCAHRATYPCPLSKPWTAWLAISGKPMPQAQFLEFIDQNSRHIIAPPAADLMTFTENFETKTNVEFSNKIDRTRGTTNLTFKETAADGGTTGSIAVPVTLGLRIPVFEGGKLWDVEGRFCWKPSNGKLNVTVQLYRTEDVLREALDAIRAEIATDTGIKPLSGAPERGI